VTTYVTAVTHTTAMTKLSGSQPLVRGPATVRLDFLPVRKQPRFKTENG